MDASPPLLTAADQDHHPESSRSEQFTFIFGTQHGDFARYQSFPELNPNSDTSTAVNHPFTFTSYAPSFIVTDAQGLNTPSVPQAAATFLDRTHAAYDYRQGTNPFTSEEAWNNDAGGHTTNISNLHLQPVPQFNTPTYPARQAPRSKPKTKEYQRKAPRCKSGARPLNQRGKRCHCCRYNGKHGYCVEYPICKGCTVNHSKCESGFHLDSKEFIDCSNWLAVCQKLSENSTRSPILRSETVSSSPTHRACSEPFILEFSFPDRVRDDGLERFTIVFRPEWQALRPPEDIDQKSVQPREPALYKDQLDDLVLRGIWGLPTAHSAGHNTSNPEETLWSTVRLFTGYHAMIHNLATTFVEPSSFVCAKVLGRVVSELIYAFGHHLQVHYYELYACLFESTLPSPTTEISPATRLYAFYVTLKLLRSMELSDWGIPSHLTQHPLTLLQKYFNDQVKHIICQLSMLECRVSAKYLKNRRKRVDPPIVEFVKSMPATGFPKHCVIAVSRHREVRKPEVPSSWQMGEKYRSVDILTHECDGLLTNIVSHDPRWWLSFEHVVDDNGKVMRMSDHVLSSLTRARTPDSDIEEIPCVPGNTDSNMSGLTVKLWSLQQDVDMTDQTFSPALPADANSFAMDGSDVPSLASSSPRSSATPSPALSPATPQKFNAIRISGHWRSDQASYYL